MLQAQENWHTTEHLFYYVFCCTISINNNHSRFNTTALEPTEALSNICFIFAKQKAYTNCITFAKTCNTYLFISNNTKALNNKLVSL
jgi:hypothetical protein